MVGTRIRRNVLLNAAPALLVLVACFQRYLVASHDFSSWKGAGFGMFATIHPEAKRQLSVTLITHDGRGTRIFPDQIVERFPLRGRMRRFKAQIINMPTKKNLLALANELAKQKWVTVRRSQQEAERQLLMMQQDVFEWDMTYPARLKAIRVDLWKYEFDAKEGQFERMEPISVTVDYTELN